MKLSQMDTVDVLETHAKRVLDVEEELATKLLSVYKRAAMSIRERLRRYPREMFSAQQMRVVLAQLEVVIKVLEDDLRTEAISGVKILGERGTEDLVTEINEFNDTFQGSLQPLNVKPFLVAIQDDNYLFNNYEVSLQTYNADLRNRFARGIEQMVIERATAEQIQQRLLKDSVIENFFAGEEWRLRRVVRTELHGIYGKAKLSTLEQVKKVEPAIQKTLYHPMDKRTGDDSEWLIGVQNGTIKPTFPYRLVAAPDETFFYTWEYQTKDGTKKQVYREFQAPPDRPNDRSIVVPFHPSWL